MIRFLAGILLVGAAQAATLVAGPMAGPPTHVGVSLWLQADSVSVASVDYWPANNPSAKRSSAGIALVAEQQFSGKVALFGLEPGVQYRYNLRLDGELEAPAKVYGFSTQALWQWRRDAPDFSLLAGSCNYGNDPAFDRPGQPYGDRHDTIFKTMADQRPDLTLWLGDNLYFREVDYSSPQGMASRWKGERGQPYLQPLLQTGAHAAIWDDHDYGPNDSNSSFMFKREALELQQRYWPNPGFGLPELPGAFGTFSFNDVDVFLLDDRYYRDDHRLNNPARVMFGKPQMDWLKNALLNSTAAFKLIASGGQMLHQSARGDSWLFYQQERDDLLKFLTESRVDGVVFLSGDIHRSELTRIERPGAYPLHDLTCSPLTSGTYVDESLRVRANLVPGTVVMGERNFCHLRFEGSRAERRIVMRVLNDVGQVKWSHTLTRQQLSMPKLPITGTK